MTELCKKRIHNFRAVHEGLIGGKILSQCEESNRVEALWITEFHKAVEAYKTAVGQTDKKIDKGFTRNFWGRARE